ncbi:MAG: hypothetical protein VX589_20595 [Myxococcota bacterium]|nr:hypothetical protein [Myxococcota bacterium]
MRSGLLIIAGSLGLSLLSACGQEQATGSLYLLWKSGTSTCDELGIETLRVELFDYSDDVILKETRCTDEQMGRGVERSIQLDGVPTGGYTLLMSGLNKQGCITHQVRRDISVPEGTLTRLDNLVLDRRRRDLQVRWYFEDQQPCADVGVENVMIEARSPSGEELTKRWACSGGTVLFREKRVPLGSLTVSIQGFDKGGNIVAYGGVSLDRRTLTDGLCDDTMVVDVALEVCAFANCESE